MKKTLSFCVVLAALFTIQSPTNKCELIGKPGIEKIVEKSTGHPYKPYATEINGKSVLIYEFSQKDIAIDFITPKKPKSFGYFIENAKHKYGNKLEFVTTGAFYDMGGKRKRKHKRQKYLDGSLCYNGDIEITEKGKEKGEYLGGFPFLIKEEKPTNKILKTRINPYKTGARSAIGIKKDGNILLFFTDSRIPELQEIGKELKCEYSLYPDSGNSRAFYAAGKIYKRDNPHRLLGNVIVGYRKNP